MEYVCLILHIPFRGLQEENKQNLLFVPNVSRIREYELDFIVPLVDTYVDILIY